MIRLFFLVLLWLPIVICADDQPWKKALAKMPLPEDVSLLTRTNMSKVLLGSFNEHSEVKSLILMPGCTDEFYFFRRAEVSLPEGKSTMLDAVTAMTNQTRVIVKWLPPHLILHAPEDPKKPQITSNYDKATKRLKSRPFLKEFTFNDHDWDHIQPILEDEFSTWVRPVGGTSDSWHFFRHAVKGWNLTQWEALEAISLANKTVVTVKKAGIFGGTRIQFDGDLRGTALEKHQKGR